MSVWGGIGEGLTAGMNARIALEEQRRREAQAQANADRQFAFQKEQAERAQGNADRAYEASRTDADRTFSESVRRADMAQGNADREFGLKQDEAALKADMAQIGVDQAERELALKEQNQSWSDKMNEEKLKSFRLANEKLDREERQAQMIDDAKRESGRQQLAAAIYRVTGSGGQEQTITVNENGQDVQKKVRVLPQSSREQIFGKDGYFRDVQNVIAFEDENGNTVAALVKPDGTMQMFSPEQQYDIYNGAFGKGFADEQMRAVGEKKDLGMFAAKEQAKADAHAKGQMAADPTGFKQITQLFQSIRAGVADGSITLDADSTEKLNSLAPVIIDAIGQRLGKGAGAPKPKSREELEAERKKLLEQKKELAVKKGGVKEAATTATARTTEHKAEPKKEAAKQTEQKKEEPKKAPIPIQRKRRHGSETSNGSAFEINEEAVAARMKREQEEEENRNRDREEFYRRMNSGNQIASASKRRN